MTAPERRRPSPDTVVIVGAGLAGLYCALRLNRPSLIVTAGPAGGGGASYWAQGGVAAALGPDDSPEAHAADTIAAGAGLCDPAAVHVLTEEGPAHVRALADLGAPFDREPDGGFSLSLEAAHSRARVARVGGDLAGGAIMQVVGEAAAARAGVEILAGAHAHTLLTNAHGEVAGVGVRLAAGKEIIIEASDIVFATGGTGGLFAVTTNPRGAQGWAMALAARAGATIADPEFVQFHPTALDVGADPAPLATEALRGEGARLIDRTGAPIVADDRGELAPRDVVARAVHRARVEGRGAFLDARAAIGAAFPDRFPTVFAACKAAALDPRIAPIPVAPASHYHMGGVATDLVGRASLPGLWALGEAASTGVHGANRLASNSLLEALVFAARAAEALDGQTARPAGAPVAAAPPPSLPANALAALRAAMHRHAGVVRDEMGLTTLLATLDEMEEAHSPAAPLIAARLIAVGALARKESRGAHWRSDAQQLAEPANRTFLSLKDTYAGSASLGGERPSAALKPTP